MKQMIFILIGFFILSVSCNTNANKKLKNQELAKDNEITDNREMAYQNGKFIGYYDFATGLTKNIIEGFDPCISPDGKWIAYTELLSSGKEFSRTIRLINPDSFEKKDFSINNNNHYGAIWSPTGEYLAFCISAAHWQVGLIKPNNSDFKILTSGFGTGLYAPAWSQDGQFIFAHNLSVLYKFNRKGELIEKYDLEQLFEKTFYFSSSTRFLLASDNATFIFNVGIDEYIEGLNEPSSAIFSYNLLTKQVKRISKKGLCTTGLWIDKFDKIYFSGFENINESRKIYQTSLNDTTLKVLVKNGMRPSIGQ